MTAIDTPPPHEPRFQIADDVRQQGRFIRGQMESPDAAGALALAIRMFHREDVLFRT